MRNGVVITGMGVVSSLGDSPTALHSSLCDSRNGIRPIQLFDPTGLACQLGAEVPAFDGQSYLSGKNLRPLNRTSRLVASAAKLALEDSGWSESLRSEEEVGLVLGTMFCSLQTISAFDRRALEAGPRFASPLDFSNTVINAAAGQTAILHNLRGINSTISAGVTSGLQAISYATDLIRTGRSRVLLAGGADELCFESFYGFERAGRLCRSNDTDGDFPIPFDARRNGMVLGEGAALLVLEDADFARERGVEPIAEIVGHASSFDFSQGRDEQLSAAAVGHSVQEALRDAHVLPHEIDCLSASANGSPAEDRHEAQGLVLGLNGQTHRLPVTAIKSMLGEALGAGAALQAVSMVETMHGGVLPGIRNLEEVETDFPFDLASRDNQEVDVRIGLINSVGFDGQCCSLVLAR